MVRGTSLILTPEERLTLLDLEIESQGPLYEPENFPWWCDGESWELGPDPEDDNPALDDQLTVEELTRCEKRLAGWFEMPEEVTID